MNNPADGTVVLHGIANCDTVKRARAEFDAQGVAYVFHDFKKSGVPQASLPQWLAQCGRDRLLNRQGTTWRKLGEAEKAAVVDDASAAALMLAQPSVVKRPVIRWGDGTVTVGWDAEARARLARR